MDNVFQSNCSSHAELLTNLRKIEKRPKIRHKAVMHPALQLQQPVKQFCNHVTTNSSLEPM